MNASVDFVFGKVVNMFKYIFFFIIFWGIDICLSLGS